MNLITLILIVFFLHQNIKFLTSFYNELNKFYSLKPQKESTKEKKATLYDNASGIYDIYLET